MSVGKEPVENTWKGEGPKKLLKAPFWCRGAAFDVLNDALLACVQRGSGVEEGLLVSFFCSSFNEEFSSATIVYILAAASCFRLNCRKLAVAPASFSSLDAIWSNHQIKLRDKDTWTIFILEFYFSRKTPAKALLYHAIVWLDRSVLVVPKEPTAVAVFKP